jgi:sulfide:quinone oxidoreductase
MTRRVLIAGGGVAALEAALALRALAEDRVSVELLAPELHFSYRPLSVAEPFGLGQARRFELPELATAAGATFSPGSLIRVEAERHQAHTSAGAVLGYDVLLVACGAVPAPAIPGAVTFRGPADIGKVQQLLDEITGGVVRSVAFAIPWGVAWSLPAYELALLTSAYIGARELDDVELAVLTPEDEPLKLFGLAAVDAIRTLLGERSVAVHTSVHPVEVVDGEIVLVPEGRMTADRVLALPRLRGPRILGVPHTVDGFVPVNPHGRVIGLEDVFAAGDITSFPLKQGGIAAQQAEVAAQAIAASAGADVEPQPFRPVLRGLLLTGGQPRYLRRELTGGFGEASSATPEPLWWPPAKIVGRYLAPFLGALVGVDIPGGAPDAPDAVPVEVELDTDEVERLKTSHLGLAAGMDDDGTTAGAVMAHDPLVVEPEDTLGQVAEQMRERDVGSAAVAMYGRLIGILTSRDLLRAFADRVHPSEARVREWMTAEPISVTADAPLEAAVRLMTEYGIHHLPVVEGDRPIGMLGLRQAVRYARPPKIGLGL